MEQNLETLQDFSVRILGVHHNESKTHIQYVFGLFVRDTDVQLVHELGNGEQTPIVFMSIPIQIKSLLVVK